MTNEKGPNRALRAVLFAAVAAVVIVAACSEGAGSDLAGPTPTGGTLFSKEPASAPKVQGSGTTYFEYQVEHPVAFPPSGTAAPAYPSILKSAGVEGQVIASFVVDTTGLADPGSLRIIKSTHQLFANSVAAALPNMRFTPALVGGRKVRQLVTEPFVFQLADTATSAASHKAP